MHVVRSHQGGDLPLGSLLEIGFLSGRGKLTVVILAPFESTNPPPRFARLWAASRAGVGPVRVPTTPSRSPGRCGARAPSARIRPREGAPRSSSRSRAFSRAQRHSSLRLVPFRSTKRLPVKTAPMPKSPARKYAPSVTASVQSTASVPKRTNRIKYPRNCRLFFSLVTGNLLPLARLVVFGYSKRRCWSLIGASIHLQDLVDRGPLDELLDVLLELQSVRGGDRVQVVRELKELIRHARVPHLVQASLLAHAPGDRTKDRVGHAGEISQGLVPVLASTKINLRHCVEPDHLEDVYHDPGLDRIPGEERDGAEELPVGDELPCEGLHEACELGVEEVEERFGRELRNSPSAVLLHGLVALERTSVGGLDKTDLGHLQDRS